MTARSLPRPNATQQQALGVAIATGAYGLSFGALSIAAGLDIWQTCALSLLLFTGGSQFAFVTIAGAGGTPAAAVATSTLLGLRNGFYGVGLARVLRPIHPLKRLWAAHMTIDESTAVALAQPGNDDDPAAVDRKRQGFWWAGVGVFVGWNAITLLGALLGQQIGDPRDWGLDAAAAAAFLALLWPRLTDARARWVAGAAAVLALALTPVTPSGIPILAAGAVAIVAGWRAPRDASTAAKAPGTHTPGADTTGADTRDEEAAR